MPRMSKSRPLVGRKEREQNRNHARLRRQALRNSRSNNDDDNFIDLLSNTFKIVLNLIPRDFYSFDCGEMNIRCMCCTAKHFKGEATMRDFTKFTLCCHKGKVLLPHFTQNAFFKELFDGLLSSNNNIKERSKKIFENIRSYNAAFAMISSEAKVDERVAQGVYHFKIHDNFYHRAGPLTVQYGGSPLYAQLYFYDVDIALNYRMRNPNNNKCNNNLMREISLELHRSNPFVRSYFTMREYCNNINDSGNENREVYMLITVNRDLDLRVYNDATTTDVAVIFSTVDGEPPFERNMISFPRLNGNVYNVSVLDSSLDPLAYPLLFSNGDAGWHTNIAHNIGSTEYESAAE